MRTIFFLNVPADLTVRNTKCNYVEVIATKIDGAVDVIIGTCHALIKELLPGAFWQLRQLAIDLAKQKFEPEISNSIVNQNGELCLS